MKKSQFNYILPQELIAKYPLANRSDSSMLVFNRSSGAITHTVFHTLADHLMAGDLLVFNDSKVIPARFFGVKETGGKVEFLVERVESSRRFIAHIKASKSPKNNSIINLTDDWLVTIIDKQEGLYLCEANVDVYDLLDKIGQIPLPLYFNRQEEEVDSVRYQTVYAKYQGSVAAPTAGLHFDEDMFVKLKQKGINIAYVTLHIGAGTFQPVRVEDIKDHKMHRERYVISQDLVTAVTDAKACGGRVIAVGTTAMRSLESAVINGKLVAGHGDTDIFITPGYNFKICEGLITNFHLPESSLLMLVAAFIGYQQTLDLYAEAIAKKYRFYSYGDVSLLL